METAILKLGKIKIPLVKFKNVWKKYKFIKKKKILSVTENSVIDIKTTMGNCK